MKEGHRILAIVYLLCVSLVSWYDTTHKHVRGHNAR